MNHDTTSTPLDRRQLFRIGGITIAGGFGSALAPDPNAPGYFYLLTDRGPNADSTDAEKKVLVRTVITNAEGQFSAPLEPGELSFHGLHLVFAPQPGVLANLDQIVLQYPLIQRIQGEGLIAWSAGPDKKSETEDDLRSWKWTLPRKIANPSGEP